MLDVDVVVQQWTGVLLASLKPINSFANLGYPQMLGDIFCQKDYCHYENGIYIVTIFAQLEKPLYTTTSLNTGNEFAND